MNWEVLIGSAIVLALATSIVAIPLYLIVLNIRLGLLRARLRKETRR